MKDDSIINELKKTREKTINYRDRLTESLYQSVLKIIKLKNKAGSTQLIYTVPRITIGFPIYDQEEFALHLTKYLKEKGFKTTFYPKNRIYINW